LIVALGAARDMRDALQWAKHFTGMDDLKAQGVSQEELDRRRKDERLRRARQERKDAKDLKAKRGRAFHIWRELPRDLTDTLGAVYLKARGIDRNIFPTPCRAVKFDPQCYYSPTKTKHPALVSLVSGPLGQAYAIHRIYLCDDGTNKMAVPDGENPRMVWPDYRGGVIRLNKGSGNLTPEVASQKVREGEPRHCRPLVLCEGVEDGLSVKLACPNLRIWAAVSLSNLGNVPMMSCISEFIICADNDWGKPQAVKGLNTAIEKLQAHGVPVKIARAHIGKDVNDVLRAGE